MGEWIRIKNRDKRCTWLEMGFILISNEIQNDWSSHFWLCLEGAQSQVSDNKFLISGHLKWQPKLNG